MKSLFKAAVITASMMGGTQAQEVGPPDLPVEPDATVELSHMGVSAGEPSATFILEHNEQIQRMSQPAEGIYSPIEYDRFAVSCRDLIEDFETATNFMKVSLRPTAIRISLDAISPSLIRAAEKARDLCAPAVS